MYWLRLGLVVESVVVVLLGACAPPSRSVPDAGDAAPDETVTSSLCEHAAASTSAAGCHFVPVLVTSPYLDSNVGGALGWGCYAMIVANPNVGQAELRLRYGEIEVDAAVYTRLVEVDGADVTYRELPGGQLPPGAIAVVSLVHISSSFDGGPSGWSRECPSVALIEDKPLIDARAAPGLRSQAIELLSNAPVVATNVQGYQLSVPWNSVVGRGLGARHLPPVPLWDRAAIDTGKFKPGCPLMYENPDIDTGDGVPWRWLWIGGWTSIVASAPNTTVSFRELDGTSRTMTLDRAQFYTYRSDDAFVGQTIVADKPISLASTLNVQVPWEYPMGVEPDSGGHGPGALGVAMPRAMWGSEYVAVRHADRWPGVTERPPWRIIGGEDGTQLSYEPSRPAAAPEQIDRGELVIFEAGEPFIVRSQGASHPFFLGGHMTGGRYVLQRNGIYPNEASRGGGVNITEVPVSRWTKRYPFFALLDWPEQSLLVVRRLGGKDVTLDCAGVLTGWQPAGSRYEYTYVPLIGPDQEPIVYGSNACNAGPHWIESEEPFRATLWGLTSTSMRIEFFEDGGSTSHVSSAYAVPLLGYDPPPPSIE